MALGANLGDCEQTLRTAIAALGRFLEGADLASLYRTEPVPASPQSSYLNTALLGHTRLAPGDLLAVAKALEFGAGRRQGPRSSPRPLDIDLLLYGHRLAQDPELTLPHPRLRLRRFYLVPLADIAADVQIPPDGATVGELLEALGTSPSVERIGWSPPAPALQIR